MANYLDYVDGRSRKIKNITRLKHDIEMLKLLVIVSLSIGFWIFEIEWNCTFVSNEKLCIYHDHVKLPQMSLVELL